MWESGIRICHVQHILLLHHCGEAFSRCVMCFVLFFVFCGGWHGERELHCGTLIQMETHGQTHKKETQTHTKLKWHALTFPDTHRAILGLNVFVTVKSDKVTCVPRVTGSFSCVFTSVCFDVCLPCFLPRCAQRWLSYDTYAQTLAHIWLFNASLSSFTTRLPPPPLFSHLCPLPPFCCLIASTFLFPPGILFFPPSSTAADFFPFVSSSLVIPHLPPASFLK